ncbi:MAG: hypothetical protein ABSA78_10310 [Candidatus Sulfotelmatobacter sp.]
MNPLTLDDGINKIRRHIRQNCTSPPAFTVTRAPIAALLLFTPTSLNGTR